MLRFSIRLACSALGVLAWACSASSGAGSSSCGQLSTCCHASTYPSAEVQTCDSVANAGVDRDCRGLLTSSSSAGFCGSTSAIDGGGTTTKSPCQLLTICCTSFPSSSKGGCNAIANAGDATACAQALAGDEMAMLCSNICASSSDCSGGQACDPGTNRCVDCLTDAECKGATGVCQTSSHKCVECTQDSQCTGPSPLCVPSTSTCAPACAPPNERCGGTTCIDLQNDPQNCGACGKAVAGGEVCVHGAPGCASGEALCGGVCKGVESDTSNCGSCGHACDVAIGAQCMSGHCVDMFGSNTRTTCADVCGGAGKCLPMGFAEGCCSGTGSSCSSSTVGPSLGCGDVPAATEGGCPFWFLQCYCVE